MEKVKRCKHIKQLLKKSQRKHYSMCHMTVLKYRQGYVKTHAARHESRRKTLKNGISKPTNET